MLKRARPGASLMIIGIRFLLRTFAWLAVLPYVAILLLVATGSPTWSGAAYVVGLGILLAGLATLPNAGLGAIPIGGEAAPPPKRTRRPRFFARGALAALVAIAVIRMFTAGEGQTLQLEKAGRSEPSSARVVDRLVDESDLAVNGARVLFASGMLQDDANEVPKAMRSAYARMRDEQCDAPSPFLATYLGLQRASAFDLVVFDPGTDPTRNGSPEDAVLFLHGFAGNFDLPCWQIAHALADLDVITACPSTSWIGDWWSPEGEAIVKNAITTLKARGVTRIVLAGLSNGGIGASLLATRMRGTFSGLVLISGVAPEASSAGIPTLVIHGTKDTMASASIARAYASKTGARYVALDAGHFAMLVRGAEHDHALHAFIAARLGAAQHRASPLPPKWMTPKKHS